MAFDSFGCCWALMCVLFVVGVMNLLWIAALSVLVLVEKKRPGRRARCSLPDRLVLAGVLLLF